MKGIENSFNDRGLKDIYSNPESRDGMKAALAFDVRRVGLQGLALNQTYFPLVTIHNELALESLTGLESEKMSHLCGKNDEYKKGFTEVDAWLTEGKKIRKRFYLCQLLGIKDEEELNQTINRRR